MARPRKRVRNITGLRNQPGNKGPHLPHVEPPASCPPPVQDHTSPAPSPPDLVDEDGQELELHLDDKRLPTDDDGARIESGSEVQEARMSESGDREDQELQENMYVLAKDVRDSPTDDDWLPSELRRNKPRTGQLISSRYIYFTQMT